MASSYTPLLGLVLPVTGELSGSWGSVWNDSGTSLIDAAISGTTSITADADITLTTTTGVANQARQAIILWNPASGTTTRSITAPAQSKIYTVINASGGTQSIVFRGAGPTTGVTIIKGESAVVAWNGTDFIKVSNTGGSASFTNVTVSGTTTLSGLTASTALALDASKNVVSVTNTGTGNNVLATSPTLVTPALGTPTSVTLTNATGLPVATGISGFGTGVATALAVNVGTAGAFVVNGGVLGTPSSGVVTNLTGTASININGTVGATTANTGAFTTLSTSGAVTISGGTANGVAYLNGSKVLTTGTALTFDGTNLNVGIGGAGKVQIGTASSGTFQTALYASNGVDTDFQLRFKTGVSEFGTSTATPLGFSIGAAEQMRLTSTGLGIGTSSPSSKLANTASNIGDAAGLSAGTSAIQWATGVQGYTAVFYNSGAGNQFANGLLVKTTGTSNDADAIVNFESGGVNRLKLTGAGNLGLGVTPSAWSSGKAIEVGFAGNSIWGNGANSLFASANAYFNGGWKYAGTGRATATQQSEGVHYWFNSASGTAGNAVTFTQAMTLDASGNLLVGRTGNAAGAGRVVSSADGGNYSFSSVSSNSGTQYHIWFGFGDTNVGSITSNGTTTVLNPTSDVRLKENIVDAGSGLQKINAVRIRSFNWKSNNNFIDFGVVAQELHDVAPECVLVGNDELNEKGDLKNPWCAQPYVLVPAAVKAIQELSAIITSQQTLIENLTTRLAALEAA
jgi:hypothetical protein